MTLTAILKQNPNIIINTDIDGVLSGLLLVKYCHCNIVGFTNSEDKVWLADGYDDLYGSVYVDMYVTNPNAICIDQHIVAINDAHMQDIKKYKQIYSPQSDDINNLRIFNKWGFENKYPFGTFQYIVAMLEKEDIHIQLPNLNDMVPNSNITIGDLLHRPDDAMKTTISAYRENAENWWNWLNALAPNGSIAKLKEYLDNFASAIDAKVDAMPLQKGKKKHLKKEYEEQRKIETEEIKKNTTLYFENTFKCKKDGKFKDCVDENGNLLPNISKYINSIGQIIGLQNVIIPRHFITHKGICYRTHWLPIFTPEFLNNTSIAGHKIFSYAFIYGPNSGVNFSFTIDMK